MNAPAKKRSIGFEKNKVASLRDGSNQARNACSPQRLASSNPNHRRSAGSKVADYFVRNGIAGIVMQDFCSIHKLHGAGVSGKMRLWCETGQRQVRSKTQRKPHHAL